MGERINFSSREFEPSKFDYLAIRVGAVASRYWPLWAIAALGIKAAQIAFFPQAGLYGYLAAVLVSFHPAALLLLITNEIESPLNAPLFRARVIDFDDSGYSVRIREGNSSLVLWASLVKVQKVNTGWLLYTSKDQFTYVPLIAFQTVRDRHTFERLLERLKRNPVQGAYGNKEPSIRF